MAGFKLDPVWLVAISLGIFPGCGWTEASDIPKVRDATITPPEPIERVAPKYPRDLALFGNRGAVDIAFTIAPDGQIKGIDIVGASHPLFERCAIAAARYWKFKPAMRGGEPIEQRRLQQMSFRLEGGNEVEPFILGDGKHHDQLPEEFRFDEPPKVKLAVPVVYPFEQLSAGISGSATVAFYVGPDGRVYDAQAVEASHPAFGDTVEASLSAWRFEPAIKNGAPSWAMLKRHQKFSRQERDVAYFDDSGSLLRSLSKGKLPNLAELDHVPRAVYQPPPVVPERYPHAADEVKLEFVIDREGLTHLSRIVQMTDAKLGWAAATAAARWQFEPPMKDGKPVAVRARVPVHFTASGSPPSPP